MNNENRTFTKNTLPRYHALQIQCIWCSTMINKLKIPKFYKAENGDWIRKWKCPNCPGFYSENVSELKRLGIEL